MRFGCSTNFVVSILSLSFKYIISNNNFFDIIYTMVISRKQDQKVIWDNFE